MKRFLPYFELLKPVRGQFVGALFFGLIFGLASGFGLPFVAQKVFPVLFGGKEVSTLALLGYLSILPLAFAIRGVSGFLNTYLISACGTDVLNQLRAKVFSKLQKMSLLAYQEHPTGDLLTRATNDTAALQNTLVMVSNDLIKYPITLLGAFAALIYLSLQQHQLLFVVILLGVIPICIFPIRALGLLLQSRAKQSQAQTANVTDILGENIRGVREVKLYNQEAYQSARFGKAIDLLRRFSLKMVKYNAALNPIIEFISSVGVTLAIYYAYRARLSLEVVAPLIMALYMAYEPIKRIAGVHNNLKRGEASLDRIEELLAEKDDIQERSGACELSRAKGEVAFENVFFAYPRGDGDALKGFSLGIEPGQVVGVVGPSGAGKSTLLNLLPRLLDVREGSVKIDGMDVRDLKLADLRHQIAAVPQEAFLFNDTVAANVSLGDPSATREAIEAAARRAQAHDFIMALPKGYETVVGEAGGQLSGGQRQRLAIARAFYKDAPILIMDEPTSALDAENESEIFASLKRLTEGRTTLIVSHRLKSLQFCHRIAYMEAGRLAAEGTHDELLSRSEGYRRLYEANALEH